jgi:N4-gp56 family major capsid protein
MAEQKSIITFRKQARNTLAYWLADRTDQMAFLTLAGLAYSVKNNGAARTGSDLPSLEFAADVTAPTSLRRLRWTSAGGLFTSAATTDVSAGDTPSYKMLVDLKAFAKDNYIRGIKGEGNTETYNVFMTPKGVAALKKDADYIANQRNAGLRGDSNPLHSGAIANVDGLMIHEFRHVPNTSGLASGSKFGSGGTVEGQYMLLCGAQALGFADIGSPEWNEKDFDYGNQQGIEYGKILGFKKPVFNSQVAGSAQDFGVAVIYTAV